MVNNPFTRDKKEDVPDAKDLQNNLKDNLEAEGANVDVFSENASPEEKARAALKAQNEVKPRGQFAEHMEQQKRAEAVKLNRSVPSDMNGVRIRPNVSLKDVDEASRQQGQLGDGVLVPGALPAGAPSLSIPEWYKVGWIANSRYLQGLQPGEIDVQLDRLRDTALVNTLFSDLYYGYLWFDGAAIVGAVALTYIFTSMGGGISLAIIVAAVASTYYTTSIRRTRQRCRDDVARELARHRMASENESAGWVNHFLSRFWLIYEPVLSATIIQQVDTVLRDNCPPFLDSLSLTTFTLGTKAPLVDSVRTLVDTEDDVIIMDWKFSFTPNDVQDMPVHKASTRINPKIVLTVRVGKGMVGAGMPILLENMSFVGMMRIRLKLISSFPHVQTVDLSFIQPPSFDYELKPIGGSQFGLDVSALPGLSGFIQNQVHSALSPMMYSPNQFTLNLEDMLSGTPLDATCGVLQVTIWHAQNLERLQIDGGVPRAYVSISLNGGPEIDRTRTREAHPSPRFRETKYILLKNLEGLLTMSPMEDNGVLPPSRLGVTRFDLSTLNTNPSPGRMNKAIMYSDAPVGALSYSLDYYPIMKPEVGPNGQLLPLPEVAAGVMRLTMHQARKLVKPEVLVSQQLSVKARLLLNKKVIKETGVIKNTNDPVFDDVTEFLVIERFGSVITVELVDSNKLTMDQVVASMSVKVDDLISATKRKQDWFPFPGQNEARMRMSAQFKPILMSGSINGSNSYRPAIGMLKFWLRGARDVKNVEALSGGKSDPYVMLSVNNMPVHGSAVMDDNLNPDWHQILYAPVHALAEVVRVELFDYQNSTADRSLGYCNVPVGVHADYDTEDDAFQYRSTGRKAYREPLKQPNGTTKGVLDFDVDFIPAMHVEGASFVEQNKRLEAQRYREAGVQQNVGIGSPLDSPDAKLEAGAASHAGDANLRDEDDKDEDQGLVLTKEQLLSCPSGVLVFNIISGNIRRQRAQLEVIFDDSYWPAHTTERRKNYEWDEVGEAVIRELDVSNVWFRLRTGRRDSDIFAEYTCSTRSLLERTLEEPAKIVLVPTEGNGSIDQTMLLNAPGAMLEKGMGASNAILDKGKSFYLDNHSKMSGKVSDMSQNVAASGMDSFSKLASGEGIPMPAGGGEILISCRYIPMNIHLEPVESVVNQGALTIELLHCSNLQSADAGGKSDPYVLFQDNGVTLARSKTVKRNLNPKFNEVLPEVLIKSRLTHEYCFNVRDWDQVSASDPLGVAYVNLAELEPFETHERTYQLTGKGALPESTITVRLTFHPRYLNNIVGKYGNMVGNMAQGVIGGIGSLGKGVATGGMSFGQQLMSKVGLRTHHDKEPSSEEVAQQYAQQSASKQSAMQGADAPDKGGASQRELPMKDPMNTSHFEVDNSNAYQFHPATDASSIHTSADRTSLSSRRRGITHLFKKRS